MIGDDHIARFQLCDRADSDAAIEIEEAGLRFPSLFPLAHAQACDPGRVIAQSPVAGTPTTLGSAVDIVLCAESDDIPEPSSLGLLVVGLGLLILFTWSRRRLG
jgi:beta-lactam-binding protein with PASTA domain